MKNEIIKLFKAFPVETKSKEDVPAYYAYMKDSVQHGFIISPEVFNGMNTLQYKDMFNQVKSVYGLSGEQMNSSFHKSWSKVKEASDEQLFLEQILHYITTYGFEAMGCYNKDTVFIPHEELNVPGISEDLKLTVIRGLTNAEIKDKLMLLLESGIALKEQTIKDIVEVSKFVGLDSTEIDRVNNKEVKVRLYTELDKVPGNATEFMRYMIYTATEKTLIIKNDMMINELKENKDKVKLILAKYVLQPNGYKRLAAVFNRYKPLLLALKGDKEVNTIINEISRQSKVHHKPIPVDYLNTITSIIKSGGTIDLIRLGTELNNTNIFRKIRLANTLKILQTDCKSRLYKIRNGKSYAKIESFDNIELVKIRATEIYSIVKNYIVKDIKDNVKDKTIYIPKGVEYTMPATEKQFVGNIPSGSYITVPEDMLVGVYWENRKDMRIDLDLSMTALNTKIGWDSSNRNSERTVMFSGDITDAPNGASELYYVGKQLDMPFMLNLNYYNFEDNKPVDMKIMVGQEKVTNFVKNYMINPNKVIAKESTIIDTKQRILGLIMPHETGNRFMFTEATFGNNISAGNSEHDTIAREYLITSLNNTISLREILIAAGANVVDEFKETNDNIPIDIDLSMESLEKDTIIKILS